MLLVTGPRQVGKSTLLERLAGPERRIVTLDDPDVRYLAKSDPALFMQRFTPPVLIDEIQYAPELLPYVKMAVDRSNKSYLNAGREPPLYYYRDKEKREIDLLLYENGTLSPVEIKKSASPGKDAVKHFRVLEPLSDPEKSGEPAGTRVAIGSGAVVCMANDLLPIDSKNWCVPVWMI